MPNYLFEFADRLVIQSVHSFKGQSSVLAGLFSRIPDNLIEFRTKLFLSGDFPIDLVNLIVKREIKFTDLYIYNMTTEYTDKLDSMFK